MLRSLCKKGICDLNTRVHTHNALEHFSLEHPCNALEHFSLQCRYQSGQGRFNSDLITTLGIIHDAIMHEATNAKHRIQAGGSIQTDIFDACIVYGAMCVLCT